MSRPAGNPLVYTLVVLRALRDGIVIGCILAGTIGVCASLQAARTNEPLAVVAGESEALIRVTAIVTDRRGQLLTGLKPGDFELIVDGKPHALDHAELSAADPLPRIFALLLDEYHTSADDSAAVRDSLLRFVDQHLRPADQAFVVKPLDPLTAIAPMDRQALRLAIESFAGRKGDYTPKTSFERHYMAQAPAAVVHARGQIVTSALRAIGVALAQMTSARPAIVLVSDGFARMRASRDVPANLHSAVRIANRADAPVFAFAPANPPPTKDGEMAAYAGLEALRGLANETGGNLVVGTSALDVGLARMVRDLENHYVLTYKAPHGSDGRFHALQVAVKREGAQVRARSGYLAPMSAEMRAALSPLPPAATRMLRRSALIQSWVGMTPVAGDRTAVTMTWQPAAPVPGLATRPGASTIVLTAATPDGTVLFDGPIAPALEAGTTEVPNRATFDAPAGPLLVDIKVLDTKGVVLDTDSRDVTVLRPRTDTPTVFPPAVMRARSAREFREAAAPDSRAVPLASRAFRRTDRLLLRVPATDARGVPATVAATLMNRWRQPMRTLSPLDIAGPPGTTQFDLPLSSLAPGEYSVRFTITHPGGSVSEHLSFTVQN